MGCFFSLLTVSFAFQKLLSIMRSHFLSVDLSACNTSVLLRKLSPVPMQSRLLPSFSFIRFSASDFMLRFSIHLELCFVKDDKYGSVLHSSVCIYSVQTASVFKEVAFFSNVYLWLLYKSQVSISLCFCVWEFKLILLVNMSDFITIPSGFLLLQLNSTI